IYFWAFVLFALGGIGASYFWENRLVDIFESFYRYGYLIFGGGQVVVPVIHTELVQVKELMTNHSSG
ncbi:MAG: chromate transporter, partial [Rhodospirillales bacterium]|nr:chromate transporter [Rhodospirillales bacterium]